MTDAPELRSLREKPFELLRELERRSQRAGAGQVLASGDGDWVGVAVRVGEQLMLVAREEVREVLDFPDVTRVPGARSWIRGIGNVRGQLVPVVDIGGFALGRETRPGRSTRLIVVNHPNIPAGLMVDEVMGFRRFRADEFDSHTAGLADGMGDYLLGSYRRGQETWPVVSFIRLIESSRFADVAA